MVYVEDNIAWPTMVQLSACLCTTVVERELPTLCRCSPVPGPLAIMDACGACSGTGSEKCGGQGWVRLTNEYPSTTFPTASQEPDNCGTTMAYVLEVGIARCIPVGKANSISGYQPPSLEQMVESTRLQMADKAAIRAAIQCCMDDGEITYTLGSYSSMQASGDCGGGFYTVTIWSV